MSNPTPADPQTHRPDPSPPLRPLPQDPQTPETERVTLNTLQRYALKAALKDRQEAEQAFVSMLQAILQEHHRQGQQVVGFAEDHLLVTKPQ